MSTDWGIGLVMWIVLPFAFLCVANVKNTKTRGRLLGALTLGTLGCALFLVYDNFGAFVTTCVVGTTVMVVLITLLLMSFFVAKEGSLQYPRTAGTLSLLIGGVGLGLLTGMLAVAGLAAGYFMGLGMGHAPHGYKYFWPNEAVGHDYSAETPMFVIGGVLIFFVGAVALDVKGSRPFVWAMGHLERGNVWVVVYRWVNACSFIVGAVLAILIASHWD